MDSRKIMLQRQPHSSSVNNLKKNPSVPIKQPHSSPVNNLKKTPSAPIKQKCIASIFQYYVTHAIWILMQHSGGQVNMKKIKKIHKTAYLTAKEIKDDLFEMYKELNNCSAKVLHNKFIKMRKSTYEEMSEKIYDIDFTRIYKILKYMVENYYHLYILKKFTIGIDLTKCYFEVDIISHNVYKYEKVTD